jgi:hypothetical protein
MNSGCVEQDLFSNQMASGAKPIVIEVRGITVKYKREGKERILKGVPSFKTGKCAIAWWDPVKKKAMGRPMTLPEHRKWMDLAILRIESTLRCTLAITAEKIRTVARPHLWIASLVPLDDSWSWVRELRVKSQLCEPGQEGATITITRLT